MTRQLSSEQIEELIRRYLEGSSAGQLAQQFEVAKSTVINYLEREQVERRPYRKVHGDLLDQARNLYESGNSLRTVSAELGVTRGAVRDALLLAGVKIRNR